LATREEWVVTHSATATPAASWDERYPWDRLKSPDRPTGFVFHGDPVAVEMIRRMRDLGCEAPRDFSVVGFDDLPVAVECRPPLTTVRQPVYDMARKAARHLLETIREGRELPKETVAPVLVVRQSTGPPPR
jgi:DNA-binding LacI/PurR family transcriptional regulator